MDEMEILQFFLTLLGAAAVVVIAGTVSAVYLLYRSERPKHVLRPFHPYSRQFGSMFHRH